jgi:hypothetical protein
MEEIFSKITDFFDYMVWWLNEYVFSGLLGFLKALATLFVKILEFGIDILKWIISLI